MRISTVGYSVKQGVKNIGRNKMFSLASIATMSACIFVFGLFFAIIIGPGFIIFTVASFSKRVFQQIEKEPGSVTEKADDEENLV